MPPRLVSSRLVRPSVRPSDWLAGWLSSSPALPTTHTTCLKERRAMGCIVNTYDTVQSRDPNAAAFPRQLPACLPACLFRTRAQDAKTAFNRRLGWALDFRCADSVVLFVDRTRQTGRTRRSRLFCWLVGSSSAASLAGCGSALSSRYWSCSVRFGRGCSLAPCSSSSFHFPLSFTHQGCAER
ncbi:uncharacterized protein IWZ02DRAFT_159636 [Phyllosticta citriasiana]|uniref:uncharacterized protein n=1 Tax=Phyllosticta citriasiana TaxID=595635 RepID=UPI0030FDDABE